MNRTTKDDLVKLLKERNQNGKYDAIIIRAANNGYHDHKFMKIPGHPEYANCNCPKVQLAADLMEFPELHDVVEDVVSGVYDEPADDQDCEEMRQWLIEDDAPDAMFSAIGLKLPTEAERKLKRAINN